MRYRVDRKRSRGEIETAERRITPRLQPDTVEIVRRTLFYEGKKIVISLGDSLHYILRDVCRFCRRVIYTVFVGLRARTHKANKYTRPARPPFKISDPLDSRMSHCRVSKVRTKLMQQFI